MRPYKLRGHAVAGMGAVALAVMVSLFAQAETVDFLFSEDNAVATTTQQSNEAISPNTAIHDDVWLNSPLTRLDYVVMNIQHHLERDLSGVALEYAKVYFEPGLGNPEVEFTAGYLEAKGRLYIKASIDNVGRPKEPLKKVCEMLLTTVENSYPLKNIGYSWANNALSGLTHGTPADYAEAGQKLAGGAVVIASISTGYTPKYPDYYSLQCMKQLADGPVTFSKFSKANEKP
jgi:hypothetical protein